MEKNCLLRQALPVLLSFFASTSRAPELGDSIDTYQNQTVSTEVFVQGHTTLTMSNVTVTPTGELAANAPVGIVINSPFKVQLGGTLVLTVGHPYRISYTYDAAGNRIKRKNEQQ